MKQYAEGRVFVGGVIDLVGMEGFNRVWEGPANLPLLEELTAPERWVERVYRPPGHHRLSRLDDMAGPDPGGRAGPERRPARRCAASDAAGARRLQRGSGLPRAGRRRRLRGAAGRGVGRRGDRRPRPAARLRRAGRADRGAAARTSVSPRWPSSGSRSAGTADPRAPPATPATGPCGRRPTSTAPASPWGTPSTTRPRPCCSASAAVRGPGRSPAWSAHRGTVLASAARDPADDDARPPAPPWSCRSGTTRGTTTRPTRGRGCAPRCCRCSRTCSAAASPRPWRAPPRCCARTSTCSTNSPRAELDRLADGPRLPARDVAALPAALRRRVLRGWLHAAAVPDLQAVHLAAVDALLVRWRGQGRVDLPGGAGVVRTSGTLTLLPAHDGAADSTHPTTLEEPTS